ncbi:GDP-Man:Man(3)GlcNAc(2)-PP-Dol alpha-1,2-mannosyltransferase [Fusarium falciforme]|uniref:GDP-Man:Man(3)GlcNAc(2)-PP-Dol alpha-1,2-mannosyltransferase n=1 Tax=Fusarium falciforme TaxID=195108 RepID=UPI002300693F|nr:GDP-Man:Man(3)GlcNAc(2)-PP-Dol alpha-1,2-mannosyltransferase [Fusarium falciforme]WAO89164.1 GDP-Man:Man(3)GlcNAc(2)-PP-Dol alpha-1,2-mannosyltransferase [Fusarium falciforme]
MSDDSFAAPADSPPIPSPPDSSNEKMSVVSGWVTLFLLIAIPLLGNALRNFLGWTLRKRTEGRRAHLLALMTEEDKAARANDPQGSSETKLVFDVDDDLKITLDKQKDWDGVVGFFHPFCNAGGGGERVLWAAIRATQDRWPNAKCVVYTGDHDVTKDAILSRVKHRFNIELHAPTITFLYLSKRDWVLASSWPHFTLLGQSIGSIILAWDAFSLLVPDVFVDTMGYAFALGLCKFLFPKVPTGAYVHYPTISTDMLESLDPNSAVGTQGVNAGKGVGAQGVAKKTYWQLFAVLYSWVGSTVDIVMTNSTWTQGHIQSLWGPYRTGKSKKDPIVVVYPPTAVREMEQEVEVSEESEKRREKAIVYLAQFRPEKNHQLIMQSFATFLKRKSEASKGARLILIGSVRDDHDSKRVYQLRLLANELGIKNSVEFHLDASWSEILEWLRKAYIGVNGMWNEHFGIGVVEYQAAGLISVVHDSAGPKFDIVVPIDGEPTGFHATTEEEFADGYEKALSLPDPLAVRLRARESAKRFTEEEFAKKWTVQMARLVTLAR